MVYLQTFQVPTSDEEFDFFMSVKQTCFDSFYPFQVLSAKQMPPIKFEPITIFYGGNGSGKSTLLNVMAESCGADRDSIFNKSNFYADYLNMCKSGHAHERPETIRIITSDDVFDYMLNLRHLNEGIDLKRDDILADYTQAKYGSFQMKSMDDYDELKKVVKARKTSQSQFVRSEVVNNVRGHSNGESAFRHFVELLDDNGLYFLDEPENSLSPALQLELMRLIEDAARFFGCQFVIATHSPFLLSMSGTLIYDLDETPVSVKQWTELENVRTYFQFFEQHRHKF